MYLGLLGNHDAAGLCQLSDWGAKEYAKTLALAVEEYKLDGVNFDDEYSGSPGSGKWFAPRSTAAGARLCYETKKAMTEMVPWETEMSYFQYGQLYNSSMPADVDGHVPGDYIDFTVANYGGSTSPMAGQTMKNCSGTSIECNQGGSISETRARQIKEAGYGWVMWFAFDPSPSSGIYRNMLPSIKAASLGLYDLPLKEPTGYYKKAKVEGSFDPQRYTY